MGLEVRLVVVSRGGPICVQAADTKGSSEYQAPCDTRLRPLGKVALRMQTQTLRWDGQDGVSLHPYLTSHSIR